MQSFSSRIWTRVVVSISYDDNHYTKCTFTNEFTAATHIMQSSSNELSIMVSGKAKM